jgi:N-acetylneuraminic acid mutarotase
MRASRFITLMVALLASPAGISAVDDPRLAERRRETEKAVQRACVERALSKEMTPEVAALPIFGEIEWMVKELPFVGKGPHAGISGAGMAVIDGQIYIAGGFIPAGDETQEISRRTSREAHRYDPKMDQWTRLPDLPGRREYTRSAVSGNSFLVLGGGAQMRPFVAFADAFKFDASQPSAQWQTLPPMQVPRTHLSTAVIGSQLLVAGGNRYDFAEKGYSPRTILGDVELLDLENVAAGWQKRAPLPGSPRGWCATSAVNGKLYVLGGVTWTPTARVRLREALCYDPTRDQWERLADPPFAISGWEDDVFRGRWLIAVGGAGKLWNDVPFVYDTKDNRWLRIASPLPPGGVFNDPGVCIIGDTIYVAGGEGAGGSHFNHFLVGKIKPAAASAAQ